MKKRARGLLDERPILFYPTLAQAIGVNKAIVLQQLHFLLGSQQEARNEYVYIDERWWVYNSYDEWQEYQFPWLSTSSIKNIFLELEKDGIVLTMQSVKHKSDRRKWYTIDYDVWESLWETMRQNLSDGSSDKNCPMISSQKVSDGLSETTSETTTTDSLQRPALQGAASPYTRSKTDTDPLRGQETTVGEGSDAPEGTQYTPLEMQLIAMSYRKRGSVKHLTEALIASLNQKIEVIDPETREQFTAPSPNELYETDALYQRWIKEVLRIKAENNKMPRSDVVTAARNYAWFYNWRKDQRDPAAFQGAELSEKDEW